jgi:DNA-binding NarL/FixJ family response regulator
MGLINVGILDDHSAITAGYQVKLNGLPDIQVAWTATYYSEVEKYLAKIPTDVLILDVEVPNSPSDHNPFPILHVIPSLLDFYSEMVIVIISMFDRRALIRNLMQAGASGYILKDDKLAYDDLPDIIRRLAKGDIYYSPTVEKLLSNEISDELILTPRQLEALSLKIARPNLTTKEMADEMNIAPSTVRNLLSDVYTRLGVQNISGAVAKARQLDLVTPAKKVY